MIIRRLHVVCWSLLALVGPCVGQRAAAQNSDFDVAAFARRCCVEDRHIVQVVFDFPEAENAGSRAEGASDGRYIYGLQWTEPRDIKEVAVRFRPDSVPEKATVEYWSGEWPFPPPQMPSIEDPADDPWRGGWLEAATTVDCAASECRYTFQPLQESENPRANNLPGLDYRRTLKLRLIFASEPALDGVRVFTGSILKPVKIRVELGAGEQKRYEWSGGLSVYNGQLKDVKLWEGSGSDSADGQHFQVVTEGAPKGLLVELAAAKPSLPGSEDITIVTLQAGERTFSFAVPDLDKGPIYVPAFHVYVTLASEARTFSPSIVKAGAKIREKIPQEPEQSYERASSEIPTLNPVEARDLYGRIFAPLAVDASWQKFAVEWGGNVFISKLAMRAQGADELNRLDWVGDKISWRIGTGATPSYRPLWNDSKLSMLEDGIPVATVKWSADGINYTEESFATLLSGPLSPDDPARSEETPAVLMIRLRVSNPDPRAAVAHVSLATDPNEDVAYQNSELLAQAGELVRARLKLPNSARASLSVVPYGGQSLRGVHIEIPLGSNEEHSVFISIPFIPRLSAAERARLAELDYEAERARILNYWQEIVAQASSLEVPGDKLTQLARAVVPHILVTVTKDPKTGRYVLPSGTYTWGVSSNEGVRECLTLDALGYQKRATEYLETWIRLQGANPLPGTFTNQQAVYNVGRSDSSSSLDNWPAPPLSLEGGYRSPGYNLNHGYVLRGLAEHYLLTRDREWLRRVAPSMMLAADWIVEQRKLTKILDGGEKVAEYGLLPAGRLEDPAEWSLWFGVNAEAVAGMTRLAEVLKDIGAREAAHYADEAAAYKRDLRNAVFRTSQLAAVVHLRDNTYVPYVPPRVYQRIREFGPLSVGYYARYQGKVLPLYRLGATREVYAGAILLLLRDVFGADEPLADWVLDDWEDNATMSSTLGVNVHGWVDDEDWFSRGGMVFEPGRNPVPTYLHRNEVPAAIRSLYNGLASTYYPDLNGVGEEYHEWAHTIAEVIKTADESRLVTNFRQLLVREDGDALWLASGTPRRWLAPGEKIELQNVPTDFGPVSYRMEATGSGVEARVELPTRNKVGTAWLVVRAPEGKKIRSVEIDGKPWRDFDAAAERIRLPLDVNPLQVSVYF